MATEPRRNDDVLPPRGDDSVTATEDGRYFFQARLSIFGFWIFVLAGLSWLVLAVASFTTQKPVSIGDYAPFSTGGRLHLANALVTGALWLATRSGQRSGRVLQVLDIGTSLALILIWGAAGATLPNPLVGGFIALLCFVIGVLARAIVVPSTSKRTLVIGVFGAMVLVGFSAWRGDATGGVLASAFSTFSWAGTAVTLSTLASHTIFGLRRQVTEARVFGQYTLETKIGEGGMGEVWRARHALLRRPTAVKLLPPHRNAPEAIARFEREVQLTAQLTHPNSIAIYDYGRTRDGVFYYAMELLGGSDLEHLVATHGPFPPGRVVHVLTQVASALAEAHDLDLVHRDVKPANVHLVPRKNEHELAKVLDFGLVKAMSAPEAAGVTTRAVITGTPLYMSPEAILAPEEVDGRSDLYAVGALGWFLLVGRPPFEGSLVEVCSAHVHLPPERPSAVRGRNIPTDLEDVLLACLAKKASDRPADARTLRARLEACESAGDWSAEEAAAWWASHPTPPRPVSASAGARTLELDART
ncbi:MAG: serine/threonine protein kinase [Deltaproteobacteria bacterium]|nr:serine/threonine protein kinase [Deltaproteobacteria bacterium]